MAEDCTRAFGRYLRMLRERRGLSLDEVCSLSQTFPEKITKGYLSRCENGRQKLAFVKVIPLSRIYEAPADVLVERMELDMELDRIGGPETLGQTFQELAQAAKLAGEAGQFWHQYAFNRDAISLARDGEVSTSFRDKAEQHSMALANCATAAKCLGRSSFALHEFMYVRAAKQLSPKFEALILERIASTHRLRGDCERALAFSDLAVKAAEAVRPNDMLGYVYSGRALILAEFGDLDGSARTYQRAYKELKGADDLTACVPILNSLGHVYLQDGKLRAARASVEAACNLARRLKRQRSVAISLLMLSEMDQVEVRTRSAASHLESAIRIAKELNDKELRFKAELVLFSRTLEEENIPAARSIHRRLRRLANWVPTNTEELVQFRRLSADFLARCEPATRTSLKRN